VTTCIGNLVPTNSFSIWTHAIYCMCIIIPILLDYALRRFSFKFDSLGPLLLVVITSIQPSIISSMVCFNSNILTAPPPPPPPPPLEVDVLINSMLVYWIYLYALSYCPSCGHLPPQTFRPFLASGPNEQASPTRTLCGDILSI
jgi:hypothetical protein